MAKEEKAASFGGEDDFSEGGGLIQGDLIWRKPRFEQFNYGGKGPETPTFAIDLEDEQGAIVVQNWSVGNGDDWAPSKDGHKIIAVGKADKLSKSSNFYQLLKSLLEGGWPKGKVTDDVSVFEGMKCHMIRIPAPKREGLSGGTPSKYEKTILVVDKVITLPWEGEGKGKGKGTAASGNGDDDLSEKAQGLIMEILGDAEGPMDPMKIAAAVFKRLQKEKMDVKEINKYTNLIAGKDRSFIENGPWTFEKGKASM